jgi:hypothetical protein
VESAAHEEIAARVFRVFKIKEEKINIAKEYDITSDFLIRRDD